MIVTGKSTLMVHMPVCISYKLSGDSRQIGNRFVIYYVECMGNHSPLILSELVKSIGVVMTHALVSLATTILLLVVEMMVHGVE